LKTAVHIAFLPPRWFDRISDLEYLNPSISVRSTNDGQMPYRSVGEARIWELLAVFKERACDIAIKQRSRTPLLTLQIMERFLS